MGVEGGGGGVGGLISLFMYIFNFLLEMFFSSWNHYSFGCLLAVAVI